MLKSDVHAFNLKGSYLAVKFVFQLISYSVVRFLGKARSKAHVVVVIIIAREIMMIHIVVCLIMMSMLLILREHTVAVKFVFQFIHQDLDIWTSLSLV